MIECPICLVENEDSAQFCRECGGRLAPKASPAPSPLPEPSQELREAPPKPRRKLHSPILSGGYEEEEEEPYRETEDTSPRPAPRSQSQNLKKGGLRSPLLGGGTAGNEYEYKNENDASAEGDYEYGQAAQEEEASQPRSRSGMRSPLLGGGSGGKAKSEFPHRQSAEPQKPERKSSGKLKSPLLDPGDFNPEEQFAEPNLQAKAGGLAKAHHHLRSPLLGGSEEDYYDQEEDYEDEEQQADPTALRSPLLAARSPRHERPAPSQAPSPASVSNYAAPAASEQPAWPQAQYQQAQPAFEPQRAPSPSQSQLNLPSQIPGSPNFTPANPYVPMGSTAPAAPAPTVYTAPAPSTPPPAPSGYTAPAPVYTAPSDIEERRQGDSDRRSNLRRGVGDRRLGSRLLGTATEADLDQPEDETENYQALSRKSGPASVKRSNPAAPLLMAAAAFALIVKAWGLSTILGNPKLFSDYLPIFLDHVATIAVLFCLIIFSLQSTKND